MLLEEAIVATRSLVYDAAGVKTPDRVVGTWLDQGQQDVAALTLCYQQYVTSTTALRAGTRRYGFLVNLGLTDHLATLAVTLSNTPLLLWTPTMAGVQDTQSVELGQPRFYYDWAEDLVLLPAPSTAWLAGGYTLGVVYAASPPVWVAGGSSVLPGAFLHLALLFAASAVLWSAGAWQEGTRLFARYLAGLQQYSAVSLAQQTTGMGRQRPPTRTEREDEVHPLFVLEQARLTRQARTRQLLRG